MAKTNKNKSVPIKDKASKFQLGQSPTVASVGRKAVPVTGPKSHPGGYVGMLGAKPKARAAAKWSADLPLVSSNRAGK